MHYVQLNNDSIILSTSKGVFTLNRYSFNYNKIVAILNENPLEELIMPLLEKPDTPDGVYFAYIHKQQNKIIVNHKQDNSNLYFYLGSNQKNNIASPDFAKTDNLLGIYCSIEEVYNDWPEYVI